MVGPLSCPTQWPSHSRNMAFWTFHFENQSSRSLVRSKTRSHSGSNIIYTHIPFVPRQLVLPFQEHVFFLPWNPKSSSWVECKVKVIQPNIHSTYFLFHVDLLSHFYGNVNGMFYRKTFWIYVRQKRIQIIQSCSLLTEIVIVSTHQISFISNLLESLYLMQYICIYAISKGRDHVYKIWQREILSMTKKLFERKYNLANLWVYGLLRHISVINCDVCILTPWRG